LADLPKHGRSATWTANERYVLGRRDSEATAIIETRGSTFPFPDFPVPARVIPPFEWAVELLAAVLATPLPSDTTVTNFRYGTRVIFPFRCDSHLAFWREVLGKAGHVAAITTNYDILIERGLRHRRMTRLFGPG